MIEIKKNKNACPHCFRRGGRKRGFSMMEVILSIAILIVGMVGLLALITNSIAHSIGSRDHIIASALAQEGVEIVRNIRDNNLLSSGNNEAQAFGGITGANCRADYASSSLSCGTSFSLKYNLGFYEHTNGTPTKFMRKISASTFDSGAKLSVVVMVTWSGSNPPAVETDCNVGKKCVLIKDVLGNSLVQ